MTTGTSESVEATAIDERTVVHLYPKGSPTAQTSICGICSRLNPTIDGIITRQRGWPLNADGSRASAKPVQVEVRIRTVTPKQCAPEVNDKCPARELRFVVGANVPALAARMLAAEKALDFARVAEIATQVSGLDDTFQTQFQQHMQRLRTEGVSS